MNNSVSFAYDDVLGDNPFSDVISPNAAGHSNSLSTPHRSPSPPVEDHEPTHITPIGATDTTATTSTDYAAINSDEKDNKCIEDSLDNNDAKDEVTTIQDDTNSAPATSEKRTTGSAQEPKSPSLPPQPPSPHSSEPSLTATTEENDQLAKTTDSLTLEDDESTSGDFGRTQSPQPLNDEDNQVTT